MHVGSKYDEVEISLVGDARLPEILAFWQGVPNILGFGAGGATNPRIFGRGCQISYSQMGVQFS